MIPILILFQLIKLFILRYLLGFDSVVNRISKLDKVYVKPVLRLFGASIGKDCKIESGILFHNCKDLRNFKVGNNCYIGRRALFDLRSPVTVGDNVVIAMQCSFVTHIDMSNSSLSEIYPATSLPILIEDDVYIGASVTVLMGVILKAKSFVGAMSLVNKDTEKAAMYFGIPAKKVRVINGIN